MRALLAALTPVILLAEAPASQDLPPAGRSLFDQLTIVANGGVSVQRVPYPFAALLSALEGRAGTDTLGRPGVAAVLIPIGRSLQRNASLDQPFAHPRIVAAVTGEPRDADPRPAALLKDRLFLGFQDEAGVIEVISYNEAAGRFEFQVVKNYRPGGEPQVFYANRTVCTACHQNAAPIFSRPSWDETNANPAVARALAGRAAVFHGVRVARGVDVPNAIDDAVGRANRIAFVQALWRDGCARATQPSNPLDCRRAALAAALKLRLSAGGEIDLISPTSRAELVLPLAQAWKAQWPAGLAEPDPNIANRDPYFGDAQRIEPLHAIPWGALEVTPSIDPLTLRPPLAVWQGDAGGIAHFVRALASMLATSDIAALDRWLQRLPAGSQVSRERIELECESAGVTAHRSLRCRTPSGGGGAASLEASLRIEGARATGTIAQLQVATLSLRHVVLAPAAIERKGRVRRVRFELVSTGAGARFADGRSLETLELGWSDAPGSASFDGRLILRKDFDALERALAAIADESRKGRNDVFARAPFRRGATVRALFARLGIEGASHCCEESPASPPPRLEPHDSMAEDRAPAALRPFYRHCGACHAAADASPPGFLHGDLARVERSIARCAARIRYRLDMWRFARTDRSKVPMPPPSFAAHWEHAAPADDLALMRTHVARLLDPTAAVAEPAYESLPHCRPDALPAAGDPRHRAPAVMPSSQGVAP